MVAIYKHALSTTLLYPPHVLGVGMKSILNIPHLLNAMSSNKPDLSSVLMTMRAQEEDS